jgi:hypothetical protein
VIPGQQPPTCPIPVRDSKVGVAGHPVAIRLPARLARELLKANEIAGLLARGNGACRSRRSRIGRNRPGASGPRRHALNRCHM